MQPPQQRLLLIIGGAAVLVLAIVVLLRPDNEAEPGDNGQPAQTNGDIVTDGPDGDSRTGDNGEGDHADGDQQPVEPPPVGSDLPAGELYELGLRLMAEDEFVRARSVLSRALFSEQLAADQAEDARNKLTELAWETLIEGRVYEDDPYTFRYVVQPGDTLHGIERALKLHVPHQLLMQVNGIKDARRIEAGDTLMMVRGPFHAVINKSDFTMDIYLHRQGLEKIFIERKEVGLGKDDNMPVGMWRVKLGGKALHPTWYPPPRSELQGPIRYGEPNYPFGELGLWIPLEGTDENTERFSRSGYGIHSTDKPESIGRRESLGCVRLADPDIEVVYALLYEQWSTVEVRP